ncbi:PEP-CTERM sorting domain-containing protein [Planctomycetales bacterium ZRK34]|nr:PEP-CTERM sorting domain-containing protein [Planctomycetales bacterium ZRK34]
MMLAFAFVAGASAAVVTEDFTYANGTLSGKGGGSGWSLLWGQNTGGATSRVLVSSSTNLSYSTGGYNITQTGTGYGYGDFNDFRGVNRPISTNLTGEVWFSMLVLNNDADDTAGIQLNAHNDPPTTNLDYTRGNFDVGLFGSELRVRYDGTDYGSLATLSTGSVHLLVGQIQFNGTTDRLRVWADPADLQSLGTALFDQATADLGTDLYLAGVYAYGAQQVSAQGQFDALRLADGADAYYAVTGVPEPGSFTLLALGAAICVRRRYRA